MKKRFKVLVAVVCLCCSFLTGCNVGDTEFIIDLNNVGRNDIFSINGQDCKKDEARLYLCNFQNIHGSAYGLDLWQYDYSNMDIEGTLEDYVKELTIVELSHIMCMNQMAEDMGITLSSEEEELVAAAANEYYESLTKDELRYMGIDKTELREAYERYAIAQKVYNTLIKGVNEEVSEDEARVIRIQQIYVKSEDVAKVVLQKLRSGSGFDVVASSYNEASVIERTLARGEYPQEVDDVVFNLDDGEKSGMIKTEDGYYFIKCISKYVEDLSEANKATIVEKRRKEQFDDVFYGFVNNSTFELNEKVWDNVIVDTSGIITTDSFFEVYQKYFTE